MHNIYYSVVFEESPPCVLQSKSESHNGCIVHSGIRTFVGLLIGWPRVTANLAGPCAIQPKVDPLQYQSYTVFPHVGPHYTQPFKNYYSAIEFLMFSSNYSPFFIVCISARCSRALSTILSIGSKMESSSENIIA